MDSTKRDSKPFPGDKANIISQLFMWWMGDLLWRRSKQPLNLEDFRGGSSLDESSKLGDKLEKTWNEEILAFKTTGKKPSLTRAIVKVFSLTYVKYGVLFVLDQMFTRTAIAIILGRMVQLFSPSELSDVSEEDRRDAQVTHAVALITAVVLKLFFQHHFMRLASLLGMRVRIAVSSLVYRKVLRMNKTAIDETANGQIVNLLSNDVSRFDYTLPLLHFIWLSMLQVALLTYVAYLYIDVAAFVGLVLFFIISVPIQGVLGNMQSYLRKRVAVLTDLRMEQMNEVVYGMRVIKMYGWEKPFDQLVSESRRREVQELKRASFLRGYLLTSLMFTERMTLFASLVTYWLMGNKALPYKIFAVSQLYSVINLSLAYSFPKAIAFATECRVSVRRLEEFMLKKEFGSLERQKAPFGRGVRLVRACAYWKDMRPALTKVDLDAPPGELCAVTGPVGSGKTTLLLCILEELRISSGILHVGGTISYASQEPWIFFGTVRQNILFGEEYVEDRYAEVLRVCALEDDLEAFPEGDLSLVGEKGVALSGGQRTRINLARAVYRIADIYLLDDPLAAVDSHTGKKLFDECVCGFLMGSTRILVTHQLQYLEGADRIYVFNERLIADCGTFSELKERLPQFSKLFQDDDQKSTKDVCNYKKFSIKTFMTQPNASNDEDERNCLSTLEEKVGLEPPESHPGTRFWSSVWMYFHAGTPSVGLLMGFLMFFLSQFCTSGSDYWSGQWGFFEMRRELNLDNSTVTSEVSGELTNIMPTETIVVIYGVIIAACILNNILRSFVFFWISMRSSKALHDVMFSRILRATICFFDFNPVGRILNRFSKDIGIVDELLPSAAYATMQVFFMALGVLVVIAIVNYYFIIAMVVVAALFFHASKLIMTLSRDLKILEGARRSPVFSHLSDSINGLITIRSFGIQKLMVKEFDAHQDCHSAAWALYVSVNCVLGICLDSISALFVAAITVTFLFIDLENTNAGLAISQSLILTGMIQFGISQLNDFISFMTSVERVIEYMNVPSEPALDSGADQSPPADWPQNGSIRFTDVRLSYGRNDDDLVLKNISFHIAGREKIGIIGRTGAGKSSIISSLFRLFNVEGSISIDGIDTATVGLHDLRTRVTIIPQEPILFSGTVRFNLDPFSEFADDKLFTALQEVELKNTIQNLDYYIMEGGKNFSVGERQLICLARAILRNNNILVLDEATANVDQETDFLIQKTIRRKFSECTVLTIAHRLNTVLDSDKILVLEAGSVVEFDSPYNLLQKKEGYLTRIVQETGTSMENQLRELAQESYSVQKVETVKARDCGRNGGQIIYAHTFDARPKTYSCLQD